MKKIMILASMFTIVSFAVAAQNIHKNDPGYHINNYKHPNKAAHAAKNNRRTIAVSENVVLNRNYKQTGTKTIEKVLEIQRTEPREVYLARQNYKMPFNTLKKEDKQVAVKIDSVNIEDNNLD